MLRDVLKENLEQLLFLVIYWVWGTTPNVYMSVCLLQLQFKFESIDAAIWNAMMWLC